MVIFIIVLIIFIFILSLVFGLKKNKVVVKWFCNMIVLRYFSLIDIYRFVIDSLNLEFFELGIDKMVDIGKG